MTKDKDYPSKHVLQSLFATGMTNIEIAKKYGVHKSTISTWRRKLKLPKRRNTTTRFTGDDYELWYVLRYEEGMSTTEIADKWECARGYVQRVTRQMYLMEKEDT